MSSYTPKNILITGAAGFLASHVCNRLIRNYPEYKIVVLDKLDYCSNLKNLLPSKSSPNFKFVKGDVGSADLVNFLLLSETIDTIMHFAAQTHVDNSMGNSLEFTKNNIYDTHILLEACNGKIKRFIHVSTDEVYGEYNSETVVENREAAQLLPSNPYSATKAGAEMLVMAYKSSYALPVITTRSSNVYGPCQFPEKLIPKFIMLAMAGKPLPVHGFGSSVRSYLYCEDVAEAFDVILHEGYVGQTYNIGAKKERKVIDVAHDIRKLFSLSEDMVYHVENRRFKDKRYLLNVQKLKSLGWSERTGWEDGLKKTKDWYTANPDWWGDVSGSLLAHPKKLMISGYEKQFKWPRNVKRSRDSQKKKHSKQLKLASPDFSNKLDIVAHDSMMSKSSSEMPLKFLIYGKTGWIGGLLGDICRKQGIAFEYGKGRLENRMQLISDFQSVKPTHVFNAAGVTGKPNVDWCETHKRETIRTNVIGTLNLADLCKKNGVILMNYATGCIFQYDSDHPKGSGIGFKEEDEPNFTASFYSKTKAMVEELLKAYDNVCTLRLRMPISSDLHKPRNFMAKISQYAKVVNIPNSVTVLDELLPISVEMAKRNLKGIWNFTNPGVITHNEILEMYKTYIQRGFSWVNFIEDEHAEVITAPRSDNELDASKLKREFPELLPVKESLYKFVFEPNRKVWKWRRV